MKAKLILHVGPHKTGTTSVQAALYENRERLRSDGILYPDTVRGGQFVGQHSDIGFLLCNGEEEMCIAYFDEVRSQARDQACGTVMLSGEEMSSVKAQVPLVKLAGHLAEDWDLRYIFVRRDLAGLAYSNLMQHLTGELGTFFRWGYSVDQWGRQFAAAHAAKEAFFAKLPTQFMHIDEVGGAGLAAALVESVTGQRLSYLVAGQENSSAGKLGQGSELVMSYPLRMMLAMVNRESVVSPRTVTEARAILGRDLVDDARYGELLKRFQALLKEELRKALASGG